MKMSEEKLSENIKIFRLMPIFLGVAYLWSIATVFQTNGFQAIMDMPYKEGDWSALWHFVGFYLGNGIPRFAVYIFCVGYILYNYNQFAGDAEDTGCLMIGGLVVSLLFIKSIPNQAEDSKEYILWACYAVLLWCEWNLYQVFLTNRKV